MNPSKTLNFIAYVVLTFIALLCVAPFYNMIINATHTNAAIAGSFQLTLGNALIKNYRTLASITNIWRALLNSLFIAAGCMALSVYFGALTAYGFAKFHFRLKGMLFAVLLGTMMVPAQLGIIGYFQLMDTFKLLDNYLSLYLPALTNAGCVFFIRQYCESFVPDSIIESGRIDGLGESSVFHRLVIPILMPAMATQAIFIFVAGWNNFINPLILIYSPKKFPISLVMQQLQGVFKQDFGSVYLGVTFSVIPILLVFIIMSKKILRDLSAGSIKE